MYKEFIAELSACPKHSIVKLVLSSGKGTVQKAVLKPVLIKAGQCWQWERFVANKALHENIGEDQLEAYTLNLLEDQGFKQINLILTDKTVSFRISKKGKLFRTEASAKESREQNLAHNREKHYIFAEGMEIPPLVDLGVFTKDYKIVKARQDKFKQINRFIEIIAEEFRDFKGGSLTIIDFGCGKSYLTFLVYYYFVFIKKLKINIKGYDLKADVVADCNKIAGKYGYNELSFVVGDIAKADIPVGTVDMILTLHACDTATDYALYFAVKHKIKHIFSVPCCQHEVNAQIHSESGRSLLLKHGLYKERFSAILTDCIRCEVLNRLGYDVDVVEFVDLANTPKNAMIRARRTARKAANPCSEKLVSLLKEFDVSQTLVELCLKEPLWSE